MKFSARTTRLAIAAASMLLIAGCKSEVYSNLPEREANEMISVLESNGISAARERSKDGTFTVFVDSGSVAQATGLLFRLGLPHERFENLGEVFQNDHMVATPFEERARFMHALNQELANSLTQIAGVASARVHVMLPENSPLDTNREKPRASIFLYYSEQADLQKLVPVIKSLVVNSVGGLAYEDVAVALLPTSRALTQTAGGAGAGAWSYAPAGGLFAVLLGGLGLFSITRVRPRTRKITT